MLTERRQLAIYSALTPSSESTIHLPEARRSFKVLRISSADLARMPANFRRRERDREKNFEDGTHFRALIEVLLDFLKP